MGPSLPVRPACNRFSLAGAFQEGQTIVTQPYYVATRAVFVLVDAASEAEARRLGENALGELYHARLRRKVPVDIRIVRPATPDEIDIGHSKEMG
jgi:hypothetical protein